MSESNLKTNNRLTKFLAKFHTNSEHQRINLQKVNETLENLNKISDIKNSSCFKEQDQINSDVLSYPDSKKIINYSNMLNFPLSNSQSEFFPILNNSLLELAKIAEGREIFIKIPPTLLINGQSQVIMMQNHSQGWIEVKKETIGENIQNSIYRLFNEDEDKISTNLSSKVALDPKFIVKAYDPEQKSNSIQIFSFLSYAIQAAFQIKPEDTKFPIVVLQKLVGSVVSQVGNERRPFLIRYMLLENNKRKIYFIKRKKKAQLLKIEEEMSYSNQNPKKLKNKTTPSNQILDKKEMTLVKNCIYTRFPKFLSFRLLSNNVLPQLNKDVKNITQILAKYLVPSGFKINTLVFDFIQESPNKFYFLQTKYAELSKIEYDKEQYLIKLRLKKGLKPFENECEGIFCNQIEGLTRKLESALISKQILLSNWCTKGMNINNSSDLAEYKSFLKPGSEILSPLFEDTVNKLFSSRSHNQNEKYVFPSSEICSINTCDLCHKILQLYICKREKLFREDKDTIILLNKLEQADYAHWASEDIFEFIDYFSFNIPSIDLVNRIGNKMISKALKPKLHYYYFGYYPISDSLKFKSLSESKKDIYEAKKNFIISNKTNPLSIKVMDQSSSNEDTLNINRKPPASKNQTNLNFKNLEKIYTKDSDNKYFKTSLKLSH